MQPISDRLNITSEPTEASSSTRHAESDATIAFLSKLELSEIDAAVSRYKYPQHSMSCNSNVLEIINKLPQESINKLKVVIATHESNGIMTYYGKSYSHHVFILGKTEDGIMIFDPQIPNSTSMNLTSWAKCVYNKNAIDYALTNDYTLQSLPQFRILDGSKYILNHEESFSIETLNPESAIRRKGSTLDSPLWKNSFCVNLYELCVLSEGNISFEDTIKNHEDFQSPLTRLKHEHIGFLRQFFEST